MKGAKTITQGNTGIEVLHTVEKGTDETELRGDELIKTPGIGCDGGREVEFVDEEVDEVEDVEEEGC